MDRLFKINLERSRIYWDYYKSMFMILSWMLLVAALSSMIVYHKGGLDFWPAIGLSLFFYLCIILLFAVMSMMIWRHENRFFEEMLKEEVEEKPKSEEVPV